VRESLDRLLFPPVVKPKVLCVFTRQMASMLDVGMSLSLCLRILTEQCQGSMKLRSARSVYRDVRDGVEAGTPFSECLEQHPKSFNNTYVGMIHAAEASGQLSPMMERLAAHMEKMHKLRSKVVTSMIYPAVILTVALSVTFLLLAFIVPRFVEIFQDLLEGQPLPALTSFIMQVSGVCANYWLLAICLVIAAALALKLALKSPRGRYSCHWLLLKAPVVKALTLKVTIGRFAATLSTLLEAGLPALRALETLHDATDNEVMKRVVRKVHDSILEGEGFSEPLENSGLFPVLVVRWIEVGERTRSLPDMLSRLAVQYEEEVDNALNAMIGLIEPLMIVFLAVVVGTIVLALFMPLVTLIESLGVG